MLQNFETTETTSNFWTWEEKISQLLTLKSFDKWVCSEQLLHTKITSSVIYSKKKLNANNRIQIFAIILNFILTSIDTLWRHELNRFFIVIVTFKILYCFIKTKLWNATICNSTSIWAIKLFHWSCHNRRRNRQEAAKEKRSSLFSALRISKIISLSRSRSIKLI